MVERKVVVQNETGIHARPAAMLVKEAAKFKCTVILVKRGKEYNAKSIMSIMAMGADKGEELLIKTDGEDEEIAITSLVDIIEHGLE